MQKNLLLVFMAVNCVMIQANEPNLNNIINQIQDNKEQDAEFKQKLKTLFEGLFGKSEDIIAAYENNLPDAYQKALARELSGEENAIEKQFRLNEEANKNDETAKKEYLDDYQAGYCEKPASKSCVKGYIQAEWAGLKVEKDKINLDLKTTFNNYKKTSNEKIIPVLEIEVMHINYEMEQTFLRALETCGIDKECLFDYNVHFPVGEDYLDRLIATAVKPVIKAVRENNIPLTDAEVKMIAQKKMFLRGERVFSLDTAEDSKKKVVAKLNDLLNPKKNDEDDSLIFDVDNDRRD